MSPPPLSTYLALARSTTGSFATVDGGNIAAAPR